MTKKGEKYRTLALNTGLFALTAMATRFISFFLVPLYTYHMSAAEYGITDMSATVISLVTPLATLAIADAAVRYIVEDRGRDGDYAAIAFSITVLSILVVGAFTPVLDFDVFGGLGEYKVLFICTYASSAFLQLCSEVSRGMGRIKLIAVCAGISSLITFGLAVTLIGVIDLGIEGYFISVSAGPTAAVAIYLTAGSIGSTLVAGFRSIARGTDKARNAKITLGSMLRYSLPLIPNSLFWWIGTSINRFFLSGMLGIASSGMFAAGGKIPGLINTAYSVFQQAWQLSAFQESRKEGLERFFSMVFAYLQSLMIMLCSIISFAAPWLAIVMLQKDFYNAWPIIPILLLANLFNILNSFFGTVYTTAMRTKHLMTTTVFGASICIVLTPLLIIPFGLYGACVASCTGNAVVFAMRAVDSRRIIKITVNWLCLLVCIGLLVLQSLLSVFQPKYWMVFSAACLVTVCATQAFQIWRTGALPIAISHFRRKCR